MTLSISDQEDQRPARFAARQPILSASEEVVGYKLLFRTDFKNYFPSVEGDAASRAVIDMSSLIGLNTLCNDRPAFIVTTRDTLLGEYLELLPPDKTVAEIPDSMAADAEVVRACTELKRTGCKIALSGFTHDDPRECLDGVADYIKIDIKKTPLVDVATFIQRYRNRGPLLIAEKVETREDFEFCKNVGFSWFEGYFFRKSETMRARGVQSNRIVFVRLLTAVSKPDLDLREVEELIKSDPTLYLRLLRYLNSAIFARRIEVKTVSQALAILGENEIRRWCRLSGMLELSKNRPSDLAISALVRARFGELIGTRVDHGDSDLFQIGMLSMMDAILEIPMREVLEGLQLESEARTVLMENTGPLSPIYHLILAVESGMWQSVAELSANLNIHQDFVAQAQWDAMEWAQSIVTTA